MNVGFVNPVLRPRRFIHEILLPQVSLSQTTTRIKAFLDDSKRERIKPFGIPTPKKVPCPNRCHKNKGSKKSLRHKKPTTLISFGDCTHEPTEHNHNRCAKKLNRIRDFPFLVFLLKLSWKNVSKKSSGFYLKNILISIIGKTTFFAAHVFAKKTNIFEQCCLNQDEF